LAQVRVAVIPAPGAPIEIREVEEPGLEPGGALLRVELSEICGTDVSLHAGRLEGVPYPLVPGHVSVGRLSKIRGPLADVDGRVLREGDRVTFLDVHRTCHSCWYCLVAKATTRCPRRKVYGITYGLADGLCGGWAEAIHLKAGTLCLPLDDTEPERFMAGGCSLPTALHAIERAGIAPGDTVLVLGSGPVGLSTIAVALMQGAGSVLCIGAPSDRLETARSIGAAATLDLTRHDPSARLDWIRERTSGRGADVTIEAAGAPEAVVQAMRFTRDAGRVVVLGQYTDHGEVPFNPHADLNRKHLDVRGCWGSDFSHFYRAARIAADPVRSAAWARIPVRRYALGEAARALDDVAGLRTIKALIDPRVSA
jgi:threonine dehydrogenase-like Zn-dependent dehydrogenase